jgi:hypothetical protein
MREVGVFEAACAGEEIGGEGGGHAMMLRLDGKGRVIVRAHRALFTYRCAE